MRKISKLTNSKRLDEIINKVVKKTINGIIKEGIDFDKNTMKVWFTPDKEEYVDTSLQNNPTLDKELIPNVNVWSLFKRKKGEKRDDGNPLIYALKGEKGWEFRSEEDYNAIENQIHLIAQKFANIYPIGVTIIIPSGNDLNRRIAEIVMSKSQNAHLIVGAIAKLSVEEVDEIVLKKDSQFRKYYGERFNDAYAQLEEYFDDMDLYRNGMFSRHLIKDGEMRNVLTNTLKVSDSRIARKSKFINGQNILIIDDTISRGQSIIEACKVMNESYAPKSITVLTLLSRIENSQL